MNGGSSNNKGSGTATGELVVPLKERTLTNDRVYMRYSSVTLVGSDQWCLQHDKRVNMRVDENNLLRVDDYYVVAMTPYYYTHGYKLERHVGATLRITSDDGAVFDVLIGDAKGDQVDETIYFSPYGRVVPPTAKTWCLNNNDNDPNKPMLGHVCGLDFQSINIIEWLTGLQINEGKYGLPKEIPFKGHITKIEPLDDMKYYNLVEEYHKGSSQFRNSENFITWDWYGKE